MFRSLETGDWIIGALTAALVVITGYYAWQNRRMVAEMSATRALTVLPKLALKWHGVGPTVAFVEIVNVGPGPALDVDAEVVFVPKAGGGAAEDRRRWQTNLVVPGEGVQLLTQDQAGGGILDMEAIAARYARIELRGTAYDAIGNAHTLQDSLADIAAWREVQKDAFVRWQHPDAERRLAEALAREFKKPVTDAAKSLRESAAVMREQLRRVGNGHDEEG